VLFEFALKTDSENFHDITNRVRDAVKRSGVENGLCVVYCPHTTAGVTINENADPDVIRDLLLGLDAAFPDRREFRHMEGNSSAHLKAGVLGSSCSIIIANGAMLLGTWQGIYFCEFDDPRNRTFYVKILL
jgi:secondary thiamine-phosphate synthase enzyme